MVGRFPQYKLGIINLLYYPSVRLCFIQILYIFNLEIDRSQEIEPRTMEQPLVMDGRPFIVEGNLRKAASQTNINDDVNGAASWANGWSPSTMPNSSFKTEIGIRWLDQAEAEHASVASFARHTLQLISLGAPTQLLDFSQKASEDEIEHSKISFGFASSFIGSTFGPGPLNVEGSLRKMDVAEMIRSVIHEGCIEETIAAVKGRFKENAAQDTAVKNALSQIASDETNHAQLAWDTVYWMTKTSPQHLLFAENVFHQELKHQLVKLQDDTSSLPTNTCVYPDENISLQKYGLLSSKDQAKSRTAAIRYIIEPSFRAEFKDSSFISERIAKMDVASF